MRLWLLLIVSVALCTIAGCSQYWYQEGKTFEQCQQAQADCFAELQKRSDLGGPTYEYEDKFMEGCMQEKGYRLVGAKELPLNIKREEGKTSMHWRARGIAGQMDQKQ
jgi:hypothetical protein